MSQVPESAPVPGGLPPQKIDYNKIVEESDGRFIFLPKEFIEKYKPIQEFKEKYAEELKKLAKLDLERQIMIQNFFFDLRKKLEKDGILTWDKNIGLNEEAEKAGKFIVYVEEPQPRQ